MGKRWIKGGMKRNEPSASTDPSKIDAARKNKVIPHLVCQDAAAALALYEKAFGAEVLARYPMSEEDARLMHSEVRILDSIFFVVDDFPEMRGGQKKSPLALGGTACTFNFSVE